MLTESELAEAYTATCHAVTAAGAESELYLGRLSLLLMQEVGDLKRIESLIAQAALNPVL
jgi:hypothetical protein